jgi:hypothetical protein
MKLNQAGSSGCSPSLTRRSPRFTAVVAGRTVDVKAQPMEMRDPGRVRLGTSHLIWVWLFGRRG